MGDTPVPTDTDTDTVVITARGLLMLNLKLRLRLHHGAATIADMVDTMVDTVDTDMVVSVTTVEMDTSGKNAQKTFKNYLQDQVARILSIWLLFPPFFDEKCLFFTIVSSNNVYL